MHKHIIPMFYSVTDVDTFGQGLEKVLNAIKPFGIYASDNLIVWSRSLGFFDDPEFMGALRKHVTQKKEHSILWRTHTLCWAARRAMAMEGDIVECGTYRGTSAAVVADYVRIGDSDKQMWLYDVFEHRPEDIHHAMPDHSATLYDFVRGRFAHLPNVHVIKGFVPDSFAQGMPDRIAFLHIDMNNMEAEVAALDRLWERVVPGGTIVFDDYGWLAYRRQKDAEDAWLKRYGVQVLEMPTGQGLVVKP